LAFSYLFFLLTVFSTWPLSFASPLPGQSESCRMKWDAGHLRFRDFPLFLFIYFSMSARLPPSTPPAPEQLGAYHSYQTDPFVRALFPSCCHYTDGIIPIRLSPSPRHFFSYSFCLWEPNFLIALESYIDGPGVRFSSSFQCPGFSDAIVFRTMVRTRRGLCFEFENGYRGCSPP